MRRRRPRRTLRGIATVSHRTRWVGGWLVGLVAAALTTAALVVAGLAIAVDRLPALLPPLARYLAPGFDLQVGGARLDGLRRLELAHVRVRPSGEQATIFAAKRIVVRATPAALWARRIDEVRVEGPLLTAPERLAGAGDAEASPATGDGGWSVGGLVVTRGRIRVPPTAARPGLDGDLDVDLRDLGLDAERAARPLRLRVRNVRARLRGTPPPLVASDVVVILSPAGLLEHATIDEVRLVAPVVAVPETLPALAAPAGSGGEAGTTWRVGRLVTHDGRLGMAPTGDLPGVTFGFAFDLRDLGLDPALADRRHRVRLDDLRATFAGRTPSLVVDAARAEFTVGGLTAARRLDALTVERGVLVLDGAVRARVAGGVGPAAAPGGAPWTVGLLDTGELGVRLTELGRDIPDVTLRIHTHLRDVPLGIEALAQAREPQRIELADFTVYSPFDALRPVVHIGSIFVDCTLADLLEQRIGALTLVSPTIFLGEDLIWYMGASEDGAGGTSGVPWTIDVLRADLGRLMLTFHGADRLVLPITFRTRVEHAALADLAALRLAAELEIPRQTYRLPALDLEFVDLHGTLRFRYPRGEHRDNLVNVLEVAGIRWHGYAVGDAWLSVTVDQHGINGNLGGNAYTGYVNGGVSQPFGAEIASGWFSGAHLDLGEVARIAVPGHLDASGRASFEGRASMRDGRLETADGHLVMDGPGTLHFPDASTLAERLPADAPGWQRDLARIAGDSLGDYAYTTGEGTLRFRDFRGEARLTLEGPQGVRRLEGHFYQDVPLVVAAEPEHP